MLGIEFSVFQAGVIALSLLYSAFIAEIFRSALQAVPTGSARRASRSACTRSRVFVSVTLPQAIKIAIPNIGSMFIGMVKDTSTFTVIGLLEVVRVTQNVNSTTSSRSSSTRRAAVIYVLVAFAIDFIFRAIEKLMESPPKGRVAQMVTAAQAPPHRGRRQPRRRHHDLNGRPWGCSERGPPSMLAAFAATRGARAVAGCGGDDDDEPQPARRRRRPRAAASNGFSLINAGKLTVGMNLQFKPEMYLDERRARRATTSTCSTSSPPRSASSSTSRTSTSTA